MTRVKGPGAPAGARPPPAQAREDLAPGRPAPAHAPIDVRAAIGRAPSAKTAPAIAVEQWKVTEEALAEMRAAAFAALGSEPASRSAERWTAGVDRVLAALDAEVTREIGPPPRSAATGKPVAYAIFAAGSYARRELSPYSDLDFGVLVSEVTPEVRAYFAEHARRIGERLKALDPGAGLHACDVISPAGAIGGGLVDTPEGMAERMAGATPDMAARPLRDQDYLRTALSSTRPVLARFGGGELFAELERAQRQALGPAHPELDPESARWALIEILARSLRDPFGVPDPIPGWNAPPPKHAFVPLDPETAIAKGQVNVKHDLMKALQIPLFILRALFDLPELGGADLLRALTEKGLIDPAFAKKLEETHEACLRLRFANHLAAGKADDQLHGIGDAERRAIRRMVPLLFRLRQALDALTRENANEFTLR